MNRLPFHRVRSRQPLSDEDFAAIRRNVLQHVREPRATRAGWWVGLAAAAVIAVFFFTIPREEVKVPTVAPPVRQVAAVAPVVPALAAEPAAVQPARPPARRRRKHLPTQAAAAQPVRIEFQTADPSVRIIWIAQ